MSEVELTQLRSEWENSPTSNAFYPLACAYLESGLLEAAADVLLQGLRHHPNHSGALAALGQVLFRREEFDEARDALERALKSDSTCCAALCTLAEIEMEAGNFQRAENWLSRAESLSATPCSSAATAPCGALSTVELRRQLEYKRRNCDTDLADIPFTTETMVELYLAQGMHEKAVAALRQLVIRTPDDAALRRRLDKLHTCVQSPSKNTSIQEQLDAWLRAIEHQKQERLGIQRR